MKYLYNLDKNSDSPEEIIKDLMILQDIINRTDCGAVDEYLQENLSPQANWKLKNYFQNFQLKDSDFPGHFGLEFPQKKKPISIDYHREYFIYY